ncbi:molybdopterin-guanine dinucleotide biosynthesis protein MobB [Acetitomaculum ruminis DSM 5522]|uniref:Molybdopterin-guanine dinucleotide biosynthesis protein MobB n=1 Tax=Acetitomaculum ruminis DSM 5522 TaxID=1120918 RepID=A0A1I0UYH2_9FIRM|nr:molybdopterin-guanine dinucleotide biosynthesis protein B [Acetitomaculum ruminis]SFA69134.1 molybdopterin-guanine dinucleotide biosynthesis protein MobB [Acetitomaculum ruminis DSM 5522]
MKICTVVGIRHSGKTTVVTSLVSELKKRGYKVATVKSIFCPTFSLDKKGSNTDKHRQAGAEIVVAKAKYSTAFMYSNPLSDDEIFSKADNVDFLILEGNYGVKVPRIVCAHENNDASFRINDETIAVSGVFANKNIKEYQGIKVINALENINELADVVEKIPEVTLPVDKLELPSEVSEFCKHNCNHHKVCKDDEAVKEELEVENSKVKHIFLTGEKKIGKSTLLNKIVERLEEPYSGYQTRPYEIEGHLKGYYFHSIKEREEFENDCPISVRIKKQGNFPVFETFENLGVETLKDSLADNDILIADELGKLERKAEKFQEQFFRNLKNQRMILGVIQKTKAAFLDEILKRKDVKVYEVTMENRDFLEDEIVQNIKNLGIKIK